MLKVGDIQLDDAGALVHITRGKTGSRTLRAISSAKHLGAYLATHLFKDSPQAPLWLSTCTTRFNQPWSREGVSRMLKATAKRAGIRKRRIHGYMFRHGSATRNAKYFTDSELKRMYGWSMASRSPAVYIHLSAADIDTRYQQVYAPGKAIEPPKPSFAPTICLRCQEKAAPGMLYCPKCATPLDPAERAKMVAREQSMADDQGTQGTGREVARHIQGATQQEAHGVVSRAGTFNSNPVSVTAGITTLSEILTESAMTTAARFGDQLGRAYKDIIADAGLEAKVQWDGVSGTIHFNAKDVRNWRDFLKCNLGRWWTFYLSMLNRGVIPMATGPDEQWTVSVQHIEEDISRHIEVFKIVVSRLKEAGFEMPMVEAL
jgi:hypothetical protein